MNKAITAIDVSSYFINVSIEEDTYLTRNKIITLVYIAQGFHLALENKELFPEDCLAWEYGISIERASDHITKIFLSKNNFIERRQEVDMDLFNEKQIKTMYVVFKKYSRMDSWAINDLLHRKGSPWSVCYREEQTNTIPKQSIKECFEEIVTDESFVLLLSQAHSKTSYCSEKKERLKMNMVDIHGTRRNECIQKAEIIKQLREDIASIRKHADKLDQTINAKEITIKNLKETIPDPGVILHKIIKDEEKINSLKKENDEILGANYNLIEENNYLKQKMGTSSEREEPDTESELKRSDEALAKLGRENDSLIAANKYLTIVNERLNQKDWTNNKRDDI